jgi:hypothetical protein
VDHIIFALGTWMIEGLIPTRTKIIRTQPKVTRTKNKPSNIHKKKLRLKVVTGIFTETINI